MSSALSIFNTTTEVPLSKAPNPRLPPGCRSINACPGCVFTVCVCVCVFTAVCVHFGWVKCRALIPSMGHHTSFPFRFNLSLMNRSNHVFFIFLNDPKPLNGNVWKFSFDHRNKWQFTCRNHLFYIVKILHITVFTVYSMQPWRDFFQKHYSKLLTVSVHWLIQWILFYLRLTVTGADQNQCEC